MIEENSKWMEENRAFSNEFLARDFLEKSNPINRKIQQQQQHSEKFRLNEIFSANATVLTAILFEFISFNCCVGLLPS